LVGLQQRRGGGIKALQRLQSAAQFPRLAQERVILFAQQIERRLGEFQQARRVAGPLKSCSTRSSSSGCKRAEVISLT
jgi:hypothetical protein